MLLVTKKLIEERVNKIGTDDTNDAAVRKNQRRI